jgi:hypothetical protein
MPRSRNPENLWKVLSELVQEDSGLKKILQIRLIGKADQSILDSLNKYNLNSYLSIDSYIPHNETPEVLSSASLLLLCINNTPNAKGILTNKFFEYMSAWRPIVAIGPEDGDAASILNDTGAGVVFGYDETKRLKDSIEESFRLFSNGELSVNSKNIEKFSRKNLTEQLSILLNQM